ncbi:hypothetical protein DNU06_12280 [Putridiphycobacter roseus]|uniref:Outer membrane protein beta-barrel domain-containing protein n=2 Tax=Putridiphycobacter roseus TaxID=2219161 RepID=A0A2W1NBE4_9FLAO|nr:hypothetical protein DNU06_12280 [Putridiphycobacter roseus]
MDLVKLKSGSEIRGFITEKTEEIVKIKTKDGSIWVFKQSEVSAIESFVPAVFEKGYFGTVSLGVLGGSDVSANFLILNGYRINAHWSAGLGIGIDQFYNNMYLPLFAEGRYNLLKKGTTPYVSLGFGYDLPFQMSERNKGGFFGQGLIGFQHELGNHFGIFSGVGFRYGQLQVDEWNWWGTDVTTKTIYEINRFDLRFGFIFR